MSGERAGRGARGGVRQRRHVVVREADADPGRLHPPPAVRDGEADPDAARSPALEGGVRARLRLARRRCSPSTMRATTRTCARSWAACSPRTPGSASMNSSRRSDAFLRACAASDAGSGLSRVRVRADGRAARATWRTNGFSNYIASGGGRDFMRPISQEMYGIPRDRVIGSASALEYTSDEAAARSRTRRRPTTSTTARRSRSASGAAPAAGRCSPQGTPTATSRCSTSPSIPTSRSFACSSCTTTPTASSTTPSGAEQALERAEHERLDGRQHQERLGDRLLTTGGPR